MVPFTPGSGTDIIARTVTERLSPQLGQAIIIENRPGAGGTIGAALVAKSDPDGYTLFVHSSSYTVTPSTYKDLPYDTLRDLTGVIPLALLPNVLVMAPSKGIRSVKELVAAAKAKPGSLNSASVGIGSATHLNAERFRLGAGIETVNIPFKGSPEALTEIVTGRVDFYFCPVNAILPLLKDGKLVALAVGSTKRSLALPDLPTTLEAGVPNSDYNFWVGMFAPAKTPREVVNRPLPGNGKGAALSRRTGKTLAPGRRADGLQPRAVQRLHPRRDRGERSAGEGGGNQAGLKPEPARYA